MQETGDDSSLVTHRVLRYTFCLPLVVLMVTLAAFWCEVNLFRRGPFYGKISSPVFFGWSWYDPEMPYFISSLAALKGESYTYVDHPGTPVEMIGSALLLATRPFVAWQIGTFVMYHLRNPELFLLLARGLLLLGSLGAFAATARQSIRIRHWSDALLAAVIPAAFFAFHPAAFFTLTHWSHNSFTFLGGTSFLLLLLISGRDAPRINWRRIALLGFLAGVLTAIQLYFITWVAGVIMTLVIGEVRQRTRDRRVARTAVFVLAFAVLGFCLATLPVVSEYPRMFRWFVKLATHQGRYGCGSPGVISLSQLGTNFRELGSQMPETFAAAIFVAAGLATGIWRQVRLPNAQPHLIGLAGGLLVQILLTTFLVLRHPGVIYGLAIAASLPVAIATCHELFELPPPVRAARWNTIAALILIGFALNHDRAVRIHRASVRESQAIQQTTKEFLARYAEEMGRSRDEIEVVWTYGTVSPCHALWLGNESNDYPFSREIRALYPREHNLNLHSRHILDSGGAWRTPDEMTSWGVIVARRRIFENYPFLAGYGHVTTNRRDVVFITRYPASSNGPSRNVTGNRPAFQRP
ncbi:MAG: hypothetical protein N2255_04455 [Kiritimatiellae bacterium]|nr:hypothetical protein [Kiritimatiellia bacterium]